MDCRWLFIKGQHFQVHLVLKGYGFTWIGTDIAGGGVQAMRWSGSCWKCRCWKMMMSWPTVQRRLSLPRPCRGRPMAGLAGWGYSPVTCSSGRKCCLRYVSTVHAMLSCIDSIASNCCLLCTLTFWRCLLLSDFMLFDFPWHWITCNVLLCSRETI